MSRNKPRPPSGRPPSGHGDPAAAGRRPPPAGPRGGAGLLYGVHPVAAAWTNPERRCRRLMVTDSGREALAAALERAAALGLERPAPTVVERLELDRLLPPGAVHQGAALDAGPLPEVGIEDVCAAAQTSADALVVVLDQVTDPHNVGAILRSASAFGARAVLVTERHAPEVTGVLAKSASGALEAVPLVRVTNLARALGELRDAGFWCVGLDESGARTLAELDLGGRTAVVLGAEGAGLRRLTRERCDAIARLPTGGPVGSLNVSNAAAVALYEVARRRG
ncbi:23S rRNA (guanosine(2251)-2'-O)-methyltransferase RlmB [Azospirillum sp. ST 5-10]|uniref:23S rRNA (guanosine(2251)-2'-O)-methyltransferase RlmB n=1 Tax=unclassified Azospirillum TaxID=2630922 RepID=UPI003F49B61C